ncbi:GNAT family N-acetyltransferase [Cytobacillus sp. BC1816]|uniref:GNAT family N-acetyltransferase n=1 Tax=Cytobacillus sp. BC1816 TaxID=3440154 RepID=UPI003F51331A
MSIPFRNLKIAGIGSKLLSTINKWVKDNENEFVIVWQSDEAVNYYKKISTFNVQNSWSISRLDLQLLSIKIN